MRPRKRRECWRLRNPGKLCAQRTASEARSTDFARPPCVPAQGALHTCGVVDFCTSRPRVLALPRPRERQLPLKLSNELPRRAWRCDHAVAARYQAQEVCRRERHIHVCPCPAHLHASLVGLQQLSIRGGRRRVLLAQLNSRERRVRSRPALVRYGDSHATRNDVKGGIVSVLRMCRL